MPAWDQLLNEFNALPKDNETRAAWVNRRLDQSLVAVSRLRGNRHVVLYGSAFLQKPHIPSPSLQITHEDLNGLMTVIHGMTWDRGLTLILHTPGGVTNAAESIVAYLRSKFSDIEVIVPTLAMSAGTMIALAANRVVMGRQSQLGPIDPQMNIGSRSVSARAVVDQFETAKAEVKKDLSLAHAWAPVLQSLGPALLQEAQNALRYSEEMVAKWLAAYMFAGDADAAEHGARVAHYFNDASVHMSHGRRIDRDEARTQGVVVEDLEGDQDLQEAVLTLYHLMTITIENGPTVKVMRSDTPRSWVKQFLTPEDQKLLAPKAVRPPTGPGAPAVPLSRAARRHPLR